jgi:hypothetical protein
MDIFSLGMVCLWLMFEKYLSGIEPLPQNVNWINPYLKSCEQRDLSKSVLGAIKENDELEKKDKLMQLAMQLVLAEPNLESDKKYVLQEVFNRSLVHDPDFREINLKKLFGSLLLSQ